MRKQLLPRLFYLQKRIERNTHRNMDKKKGIKVQKISTHVIFFMAGCLFFLTSSSGLSATIFQQINDDGFGNPQTTGGLERQTMAVFQGKLYVGAANRNDGAVIMSYDGQKWEQVAKNGFGNSANTAITNLFATEQKLYAGTRNNVGGEVWEYDGDIGVVCTAAHSVTSLVMR
jgi:hypothetical protein